MSRRTSQISAILGFVALVSLHLDFWRPQRSVLWFGWLPEELAYRIAYCLAAWLFILFVCRFLWREEPDS